MTNPCPKDLSSYKAFSISAAGLVGLHLARLLQREVFVVVGEAG